MFEHALNRASTWFQIHADQRLRVMNFYVILLAGTLAILGSAIDQRNYVLEVIAGVSVAIVTFVFKSLDRRSATLVKSAECALDALEKEIQKNTNINEIRLIEAAERKAGQLSYRQSFNVLFGLGYGLSVISVVLGLWPYIRGF